MVTFALGRDQFVKPLREFLRPPDGVYSLFVCNYTKNEAAYSLSVDICLRLRMITMAIEQDVRERIRLKRESLGRSQTWMAKQLGISQPSYKRIEGGEVKLTLETLERVATLLRSSVAELMGYDSYVSDINTPADNLSLQRQEAMLRFLVQREIERGGDLESIYAQLPFLFQANQIGQSGEDKDELG